MVNGGDDHGDLRLWPEAQFAYGPPVDNGLYYDVDLDQGFSTDPNPKLAKPGRDQQ